MTQPPAGRGVAPLSPRQAEVLRFIVNFYRRYEEAPTERFVARQLGVRLAVVQGHLAALYRKGWLRAPTPDGLHCPHLP